MSADVKAVPLRASRYDVPRSFYLESARRVSVLRSAWYSLRFRGRVLVGRGTRVRVHRSASLRLHPGSLLVLGLAHDSAPGAVLRMRPRSVFEVRGRVQVMRAATVTVGHGATLTMASGTFVNDGATVVCLQQVDIGLDCAISWGVRLLDTDVHELVRDATAAPRHLPVSIGDRCWIGAGATILKGVRLGPDCVVAAGSVVTRSAAQGQLLGGVPATVLADSVSWRH
jgi:acetyltransferase-like isoleucine patch superfamily enzyme